MVGLLPDMSFHQATLGLKKGDLLVAFTDGISEAMNPPASNSANSAS